MKPEPIFTAVERVLGDDFEYPIILLTPQGRLFNQKVAFEPENLSANYYYLESRIHIKNNDYQKAKISLQKAFAKDPDSFILTRDMIRIYLREKNDTKALELAEKLVQQSPDSVDGLLLLIQLKKESMDEKKLVELLNKILELDPKNKETFLRLGKIYLEKKNSKDALILFKKMVENFPDYYVAWFYLGEVYLSEKQYDLATTQFLKTIELEPDLVEPRFQLIKINSIKNTKANNKKILELYDQILEIEPENLRALLGKALHYYKTNNKKQATSMFMELGKDINSDSSAFRSASAKSKSRSEDGIETPNWFCC
jgi:tetratricopeptide (TPR) repeat protein